MAVYTDYERLIRDSPILLNMTESVPYDIAAGLVDSLVAAGKLPAALRDPARAAIHRREILGARTALAHGIAIPHGYLAELDGMIVAIGVHRTGLDCCSIDGGLTRIFVVLLDSGKDRTAHIKFLAALNRQLLRPGIRERILLASTPEEVKALLCEKENGADDPDVGDPLLPPGEKEGYEP